MRKRNSVFGRGGKKCRRSVAALGRNGVAAAAIAGILYGSSAYAQQRVIVEKATGNVVDVGDSTLQYDHRYFDHLDFAGEAIPPGANVRKYTRDTSGAIVLRPKEELESNFEDERRKDLISRINASAISAELKALLLEIVSQGKAQGADRK
jgi:hypothetical protein